MASIRASGHCHKPQHLRTCALCFFVCILMNPQMVFSDDVSKTTLPASSGLSGNGLSKDLGSPSQLPFVHPIFAKYGQNGTMAFEAFEHLLHSLGLVKSVLPENHVIDHDLAAHIRNGQFQNIHDHNNHEHANQGTTLDQEAADLFHDYFGWGESDGDHLDDHSNNQEHLSNNGDHDHSSHDHSTHDHQHDDHNHETHHSESSDSSHLPDMKRQTNDDDHQVTPVPNSNQRSQSSRVERSTSNCMSAEEILRAVNITKGQIITEKDFVRICPVLIYQLDRHVCDEKSHEGHHHDDHSLHDHGALDRHGNETDGDAIKFLNAPLIVWGYSLLSVFIISLVGLLGVAIVPVMQKVFYNHLLQFLVALAVGSLTGDALLHLLPHSLAPHDEHDDHSQGENHGGHSKQGIYKGLVAFAGVYFFFVTERIMGLVTEWRRRINREKNKKVTEANTSPKLLREYSEMETEVGFKLTQRSDGSCEERMMMVHPSKDLRNMAEDMHEHIHRDCGKDDNKRISHSHGGSGHNHGHGHSHDVPDSVASVAWMVIMGDGLHNFSDGLAIGAAFANSMSGGLSTSIAVFCHELPHELGDFAMLLRAGMSVRQALVYNCVSSILCLIGMVVGVAAGNIESVSLWIFALAGGMFIYIALVDMLPEMINNAPKHGENPVWHLILQNVGILIGTGIMLVIALYEDKIMVPEIFP